jgi:hypothetical protein
MSLNEIYGLCKIQLGFRLNFRLDFAQKMLIHAARKRRGKIPKQIVTDERGGVIQVVSDRNQLVLNLTVHMSESFSNQNALLMRFPRLSSLPLFGIFSYSTPEVVYCTTSPREQQKSFGNCKIDGFSSVLSSETVRDSSLWLVLRDSRQ